MAKWETPPDWREIVDDSRVSVFLSVKGEWCTGRGIRASQPGCCRSAFYSRVTTVITTAAAQEVGRSVHRAHRGMERRNFSYYAGASHKVHILWQGSCGAPAGYYHQNPVTLLRQNQNRTARSSLATCRHAFNPGVDGGSNVGVDAELDGYHRHDGAAS